MRRIPSIAVLVSITVLVAGCGGLPRLTPVGSTLLVKNEGLGQLVLRDTIGRLATLTPGQERCVALRRVETVQSLVVVSEGRYHQAPVFIPSTQAGWKLVIGTVPLYPVLGLVPVDAPCNPWARRAKAEVRR